MGEPVMRDPTHELDALAACARQEQAPPVSVAPAVTSTLRALRQARTPRIAAMRSGPLLVFALGSSAAAAVVTAVSVGLIQALADPLGALFQVTPVMTQ